MIRIMVPHTTYSVPKSFCSRHSFLSCSVVLRQDCNQIQLFVGHQRGGRGVGLGTATITTASYGGTRQRREGQGIKKDASGTIWDVTTLSKEARLKEAVKILDVMEEQGYRAYTDTCARLLQGCVKTKALEVGKGVHDHIIKSGSESDTFLGNTLVTMYCKCGSVADAREVFDKIPKRNVVSWTAMIAGLAQQGLGEEAIELFRQMQCEGVKPNKVTFMSILKACASPAALKEGKWLHAAVIEAGLESDVQVGTALVSMYGKCGSMVDASQVFAKMPERNVVTFMSVLNACVIPEDLEEGKQLHASIIKAGLESDVRVGTALVSMYCKCGSVVDARQVFDKMLKRDVVSWTAMIAGSAQHGHGEEAFELFQKMQSEGFNADKISFVSILNACSSPAALEQGKWLHSCITKAGFVSDIRVGTALISMYCKCGSVVDARQVFDAMPVKNVVTFISILNACSSPASLEQGKGLHASIIKAGFESDVRVGNSLVSMYCKCGSLIDAREVFNNMLHRDVISWTAMISGCAQHGNVEEAFELFGQMQREGMQADKVTFMSILNACANPAALGKGKWLHTSIVKAGFEADVRVGTALVSMYCKCGSVEDAQEVFFKMPERTVVSWNAMISGLAQHSLHKEAVKLFCQMQQEVVKADKVTFMSILNACCGSAAFEQGKQIHAAINKAGFGTDVQVGSALVSMYCKCGCVVDARQVFENMPERDVVSWTAMIAGCAQHGHVEEALNLFRQMEREGVKPDKVTFLRILNTCAGLASLEEGKWVHAHIIKSGSDSDVSVSNALVDMYAKCGSMGDAWQVFDQILSRDVFSWSAMINGYAQHGNSKDALQFFEEMQEEGVEPNEVTFIGVLAACCHSGLVDEGHHYFNSMRRDFFIMPTGKHYGCMVDLLSRAGRLDEAEGFINKMPIEPDASVWGTLLGACRFHGNVALAERAAECILKLEPQSSSVYVLLSDIYALAGRWDDVAKVTKVRCEEGARVLLD